MATPETEAQKKKLKQIYIGLVIGGLLVGGALSVGIVFALQRLGLTQSPRQEQPRSQDPQPLLGAWSKASRQGPDQTEVA